MFAIKCGIIDFMSICSRKESFGRDNAAEKKILRKEGKSLPSNATAGETLLCCNGVWAFWMFILWQPTHPPLNSNPLPPDLLGNPPPKDVWGRGGSGPPSQHEGGVNRTPPPRNGKVPDFCLIRKTKIFIFFTGRFFWNLPRRVWRWVRNTRAPTAYGKT